jgi:glycosyltransferase involved in cell wall biosynthesis
LSTHPIQYHSAWFRALAAQPDLEVHVYYCHNATPQDQSRAGFGVEFDWDIPLLTGYPHSFLHNVANPPAYGRFAGFDTPEIKDIISSREYDAVLVNGWHYKSAWQAIWACWRSGVKVLVRSDSHLHTPRSFPKKMVKEVIYPRFIPRFDACLSVGKWSREYFLHYGASPERVFFVPHAVDNERMSAERARVEPSRVELRKRWGLDEKAMVVLLVGKFIDKKRPMDFLQAVHRVQQEVAVQALMVGDGPLRGACEEFVRVHDLPVCFAGFLNQSKIVEAYVASDILILPSDGDETWGLVVNEAMVCGLPCVVSSAVGCGPDLILPGETGLIYPVGDVDALSEIVMSLAKRPLHLISLGVHARERVKHYSVQSAVKGLLESLKVIPNSRVPDGVAD